MPVTPAASWPPGIGVAKVYVDATRRRSESELEVCGGQATGRKSKGSVSFFAELGKLRLMFFAGFGVNFTQFQRARNKAATFGLLTFACPFIFAISMAATIGYSANACAVIGAFLAGVSLKRAFGELKHDDSLEVMSQALFIPVFFIAAGFQVDFKVFFGTLSHQPLLVLGVLGALFGGKWLAAEVAGRWLGYGRPERDLMFALTVPQVAATLAVALVAYATVNASGQRPIDQAMLNATVVLVIVSSLIGLVLTERAARLVKQEPTQAPIGSGGLVDVPPTAE